MTLNQKRKQARHNAEKDAKRRRYSVGELEQIQSDMRRQAAELTEEVMAKQNALEDNWVNWVATWNRYAIPRLSVGFFVSAFRIMRKYLVAGAIDSFMSELSESMQKVIEDVGAGTFSFEDCRDELARAGYSVPEWAEEEDFEIVRDRIKAAKRRDK